MSTISSPWAQTIEDKPCLCCRFHVTLFIRDKEFPVGNNKLHLQGVSIQGSTGEHEDKGIRRY